MKNLAADQVITDFRKSTHSGGANDCVEVQTRTASVLMRDTQNRALGHLGFSHAQFAEMLAVGARLL